jgi:hypothetical protein
MKHQQAWEAALGQLQMEMPKAAFDTWVRDAQLISYEDGEFTIGVFNAYARDWLESRLSSTLTRLLTGIMNTSVEIQFMVWEDTGQDVDEPEGHPDPEELQLQIRITHQSLRDALTEPHKVVVIPGYFRRWVPFLGPTLAWIVVGFRQVMYLSTRHKVKQNVAFRTSPQQVARWAGIARNTLWRNLKDHRLRWFLKQPDPGKHVYEFIATMPLTPGDADQLQHFLIKVGAQSDPITALERALNTPVSQILPYPPLQPEEKHLEMEPMPRSVQDVVIDACGNIKASAFKQVTELADQLAAHLIPPKDVIVLSHYFLLNWVKHLGTAPSWFITLLRDQCYIGKDEIRNTVWVHGGDPEIAQMLGLNRPKTISEWLTPLEDSRFERPLRDPSTARKNDSRNVRTARREIKRNLVRRFVERIDYLDQSHNTAWQFKVNLVEPLVPEDQENYDRAINLIAVFLETDNIDLLEEIIKSDGAFGTTYGALGTSGGAFGTFDSGMAARLGQVTARLEQIGGAFGTSGGAHETSPGRVWNALSSLNHLKEPMINLLKHLKTEHYALSTDTTALQGEMKTKSEAHKLVVGEVPDSWDLETLLAASQLHPGTRKKLLEREIEPWILVSQMLYAHSREATNANSPMAIVGSALNNDPFSGFGGHYDVLAQLPPKVLADLIKGAYSFAIQYPNDYYHNWQSGNQAWDLAMSRADPNKLLWLAVRLGIVKM